jgi:hypothetical protein
MLFNNTCVLHYCFSFQGINIQGSSIEIIISVLASVTLEVNINQTFAKNTTISTMTFDIKASLIIRPFILVVCI